MMRKDTLFDRIEKAEEFIEKKELTIEKKHRLVTRKEKKLLDDFNITYTKIQHDSELQELGFNREQRNEIYWLECDISNLWSDLNSLQKQKTEKKQKLAEYKAELEKVEAFEAQLVKEVPEAFNEARAELVEQWLASDLRQRAQMLEDSKTMDRHDFRKKWSYNQCEYLMQNESALRRINERDADAWLIDLYNRVKEYTGTITDASNIRFSGKALNGFVHGTMGSCEVETIGAGGYNIQRYHLRVLVKKYNLK